MLRLLVLASGTDVETVDLLLTNAGWRTRRIRARTNHLVIPARRRSAARDVLLADVDVLTATEQVREIRRTNAGSRIRIILAAQPNDDVVRRAILRALEEGADDFVNAAALRTELALRLEALVRREQLRAAQRVRTVYGMTLQRGTRRLENGEKSVTLTRSESRVLRCLASHAGTPVSRALIRERLGTASKARGGNYIDVLVLYLRRKLAEVRGPCDIRTVRGVGYVLTAAPLAGVAPSGQDGCVTAM